MADPSTTLRRRIGPTLRSVFGLRALRPGQHEVIERVLAGRPTLAVMPTGAGKSLCYQLPALLRPGRTLVVSPLIALMKDQCDRLRALGVDAWQWHSGLDAAALAETEAALDAGAARILFLTPERLVEPQALALLARTATGLLVVDEAHCISHWGHDFRPAYLEIAPAREALGGPPVVALTATATERVADDIVQQFGIPPDGVVHAGSYRPNLHYRVEVMTREADKLERVCAVLREEPGAGIVYTATVRAALAVQGALDAAGIAAGLYHGRLGAAERTRRQDAFMAGRCRVMVATNAFGLGIDKADLRFVLHYQMPAGLDAYYQESGRAGRDGERAVCTLLYLRSDKAVQQFFLAHRYPGLDELSTLYAALSRPPPDGSWTLEALQRELDRPALRLRVALALLRRQHLVRQDRQGALTLRRRGLDDNALAGLAGIYVQKKAEDQALLEQMVFYAQTGWCRWRVLLEHLGARPAGFDRCGHCDNCVSLARHLEQQAAAAPEDTPADEAGEAARRAAFAAGDAVRVRRYGAGRVVACDALSVEVEFPNAQRRCFLPEWVTRAGPRRPAR